MTGPEFDVAIVGYGPVGQTLALLLARRGYKVAVVERWPGLFPLPRACVLDHEAMRILQSAGVAADFAPLTVPTSGEYVWLNAEGETLYHFRNPPDGVSGWPSRQLIYQPELEATLDSHVRSNQAITLLQGWQACGLVQRADQVSLSLEKSAGEPGPWRGNGEMRTLHASFVVGCDGANSYVREAAELGWTDLGFRADWLVIDYRPHHPEIPVDMPEAGQICDPARPTTLMRHMGRHHVRWEMMLLPGETAQEMTEPERVWAMIDRWVKPPDGEITRAAVYTFQSGVADQWSRGRAMLAGDSAHLMPPFLGQGLCSGLRDAVSLTWRLDLILRGVSELALMGGYQTERKAHVEAVIERAVALGKVVCMTDPREATARDRDILSGIAPPIPAFPHLSVGVLQRGASPGNAVGQLSLQAEVSGQQSKGLFDDVVGAGWTLITLEENCGEILSAGQRADLERLGAHIVSFGPARGCATHKGPMPGTCGRAAARP